MRVKEGFLRQKLAAGQLLGQQRLGMSTSSISSSNDEVLEIKYGIPTSRELLGGGVWEGVGGRSPTRVISDPASRGRLADNMFLYYPSSNCTFYL